MTAAERRNTKMGVHRNGTLASMRIDPKRTGSLGLARLPPIGKRWKTDGHQSSQEAVRPTVLELESGVFGLWVLSTRSLQPQMQRRPGL